MNASEDRKKFKGISSYLVDAGILTVRSGRAAREAQSSQEGTVVSWTVSRIIIAL